VVTHQKPDEDESAGNTEAPGNKVFHIGSFLNSLTIACINCLRNCGI